MKGMDVSKMLQQVQQMQAEMAKAQEELANETVEASAGGGMVTVVANAPAPEDGDTMVLLGPPTPAADPSPTRSD